PKKTRGGAVQFALDLHYADEKSAFGKQTVGSLTGSMLLRGAGKRDRQQIEDRLDELRAKVDAHGSVTGTTVYGQTFSKELPETLRLVADVLRAPTFPPAELDKLK